MEARKRALEAKKRKELAMQEMQRHEEASKISVSRRISLRPRQTSPFQLAIRKYYLRQGYKL